MDRSSLVFGYNWLIEWSATSFYIKSLLNPFKLAKVSIHGPDPNHDDPHNRFDLVRDDSREIDAKIVTKAVLAGGGVSAGVGGLPLMFSGRRVKNHVTHLLRFSTEGRLFGPGMPSCPAPQEKEKAVLALIPAPPRANVVHIDVYLSSHWPYWPGGEKKIDRERRGIGPLKNRADLYLTVVAEDKPPSREPDPFGDLQDDENLDACFRDMVVGVDQDGLLWVCEKLIPFSQRLFGEGRLDLPGGDIHGFPAIHLPGFGKFIRGQASQPHSSGPPED